MSESTEFRFELAQAHKRELYLARIRANTQRYCDRYRAFYDDMVCNGYDRYLPQEFSRVREDLEKIEGNLDTDTEAARDISMHLGAYITQLPVLAREAKREFEARERQRRRELEEQKKLARSELEVFLHQQLISFDDPVVRDFACDQLRALRGEYADRNVSPGDLDTEKKTLRQRFGAIRAEAEAKASAWKQQKRQQTRAESQCTALEICRENIAQDKSENPKAIQELLDRIAATQHKLTEGPALEQEELQQQLLTAVNTADEAVVDERCRKETVKAIVGSLRKVGFVVDCPRRHKDGDSDEVVVMARKPAGNQAEVRVTIDGGFLYRFDNYKGMSCKKDIDKFLPMVKEIYGIKLSDKRVLWQNPDRLSRSARPIECDRREQKNG